jgi:hypothetical protein
MRRRYVEHDDVVKVVREQPVHLAAMHRRCPVGDQRPGLLLVVPGHGQVPTGSGARVDLDSDAVTDHL